MNAKKAKALRRQAREQSNPGANLVSHLGLRHKRDNKQITVVVHPSSTRGVYHKLKIADRSR